MFCRKWKAENFVYAHWRKKKNVTSEGLKNIKCLDDYFLRLTENVASM